MWISESARLEYTDNENWLIPLIGNETLCPLFSVYIDLHNHTAQVRRIANHWTQGRKPLNSREMVLSSSPGGHWWQPCPQATKLAPQTERLVPMVIRTLVSSWIRELKLRHPWKCHHCSSLATYGEMGTHQCFLQKEEMLLTPKCGILPKRSLDMKSTCQLSWARVRRLAPPVPCTQASDLYLVLYWKNIEP